jgi:probable addiction module antidote protein
MKLKTTKWAVAKFLNSEKDISTYMEEAFKTGDASYVAHALGVVARAKGMAEIAEQTGLSREQLYRSFSGQGNPTLKTTLAVMKTLGLQLTTRVPKAV